MAKSNPADVIDAYRQRQGRKSLFTFADISKALLFLIILASSIYALLTGGPELPTLVDLKTNTPTYTPSITPTASATATITQTPTETPDPKIQCDCPATQVVVITATFQATDVLPSSLPSATQIATIVFTPTATLLPTESPIPTNTSIPTPTPVSHTVQRGDTLGGIALRYDVTVEEIQALNNLETTMIYEGQVLQIP
jgi:LysM repeat protein